MRNDARIQRAYRYEAVTYGAHKDFLRCGYAQKKSRFSAAFDSREIEGNSVTVRAVRATTLPLACREMVFALSQLYAFGVNRGGFSIRRV